MAPYHNDVMCDVSNLQYDFDNNSGRLTIGKMQAPDKAGCINLFQAIDPNVTFIEVFAGEASDTIYKNVGGQWEMISTR